MWALPTHLAPELDAAAVGELDLLDAAADPGPGLEHRDLGSAASRSRAAARPARPAPTTTTSRAAHAPAAPSNRAGAGSGPSWPTRIPTVVAMVARASSIPRLGSLARTRAPSPSVSATAVSASDRGSSVVSKTPAASALADDVGRGGVEVLVEVGADLGEVRVADAQQGQLLPEQPLVRALLVAGQAPVEEGREPFGGALAGAGQRALVELGRDPVGVRQHLAEEELLGVEVVVQQAGRHPGGAGDRGHPDLGQAVADDAVGGRGEDPGACLRGRLLALGGPQLRRLGRGRVRRQPSGPHLLDCSVSQ